MLKRLLFTILIITFPFYLSAQVLEALSDDGGEEIEVAMLDDEYTYVSPNPLPNPIVERMSCFEVAYCVTPASVAYNFVIAMVTYNKERLLQLSSNNLKVTINEHYSEFSEFVDKRYNRRFWLPIPQGWEIAALYTQEEDYSSVRVYVNIVPSYELNQVRFQEIKCLQTMIKVILILENGKWVVNGFV